VRCGTQDTNADIETAQCCCPTHSSSARSNPRTKRSTDLVSVTNSGLALTSHHHEVLLTVHCACASRGAHFCVGGGWSSGRPPSMLVLVSPTCVPLACACGVPSERWRHHIPLGIIGVARRNLASANEPFLVVRQNMAAGGQHRFLALAVSARRMHLLSWCLLAPVLAEKFFGLVERS
jgi:hypothetical protein